MAADRQELGARPSFVVVQLDRVWMQLLRQSGGGGCGGNSGGGEGVNEDSMEGGDIGKVLFNVGKSGGGQLSMGRVLTRGGKVLLVDGVFKFVFGDGVFVLFKFVFGGCIFVLVFEDCKLVFGDSIFDGV